MCSSTTSQKIIGSFLPLHVTGSSNAFSAVASDNFSAINLNGTTQGGGEGTVFSLTCIAADLWVINNAAVMHSGSPATPFTTT